MSARADSDARDIQAHRRIGLTGFQHPIVVLDRQNQTQSTVAQLSVFLPTQKGYAGTDRPAIMAILSAIRGELTIRNLPELLRNFCRKFDATEATVRAHFPYFIQASERVQRSQRCQVYDVSFTSTLRDDAVSFRVGVTVPVGFYRGSERVSGQVELEVEADAFIWIEDMVSWIHDAAQIKDQEQLENNQTGVQEETLIESLRQRVQAIESCQKGAIILSCPEQQSQCMTFSDTHWTLDDDDSVATFDSDFHPPEQVPSFSFGAWLKEQRQARQMSQIELAQRIGVTASFLSRLENGERSPSHEHLTALARVMGLDGDIVRLRAGLLTPELLASIQRNPEAYLRFAHGRRGPS